MAEKPAEQLWRELYGDITTLVEERYPERAPGRRPPVVRDEVDHRREALVSAMSKPWGKAKQAGT